MKRSAIYREAAVIVGWTGKPSCLAIEEVLGREFEPGFCDTTREYASLFSPTYPCSDGTWGAQWGVSPLGYDHLEATECRMLSLYFMAAIEDEEAQSKFPRAKKKRKA